MDPTNTSVANYQVQYPNGVSLSQSQLRPDISLNNNLNRQEKKENITKKLTDLARHYFENKEFKISDHYYTQALKECGKKDPFILQKAAYCKIELKDHQAAINYFNQIELLFHSSLKKHIPAIPVNCFFEAARGMTLCGNKHNGHQFFEAIICQMQKMKIPISLPITINFVESKMYIGQFEEAYELLDTEMQKMILKIPPIFHSLKEKLKNKILKKGLLLSNKPGLNSSKKTEILLKERIEQAKNAYINKNYRVADFLLEDILLNFKNSPIPFDILIGCALIKIANGKFEETEHFLTLALEEKTNPILFYGLASLNYGKREFELAEENINLALACYDNLDEIPPEFYYMKALIKFRFDEWDEAEQQLDLALPIAWEEDHESGLTYSVLCLLGQIKLLKREFEAADEYFYKIKNKFPIWLKKDIKISLCIAVNKFTLKQYDEANEFFANAKKIYPKLLFPIKLPPLFANLLSL